MDTDDLSIEAYQGIIIEAEKFNHDLTLQFGVLASSCKDEEEYLENALKLIDEIKTLDSVDLEDLFFGQLPDIKSLHQTLNKIIENIIQTSKLPKDKRHNRF